MKRSRESEEDCDTISDSPYAPSIAQSDVGIRHVSKITELDSAVSDTDDENGVAMKCFLPPHREPLIFNSYEEYESHYRSFHTHRCLDCRKNFPSEHLLNVHIEEWHDPLVVVKRDRGEHTVCITLAIDIQRVLIEALPVFLFRRGVREEVLDTSETPHALDRQACLSEKLFLRYNQGWHRWQTITVERCARPQ
jgi:hypothetical protein